MVFATEVDNHRRLLESQDEPTIHNATNETQIDAPDEGNWFTDSLSGIGGFIADAGSVLWGGIETVGGWIADAGSWVGNEIYERFTSKPAVSADIAAEKTTVMAAAAVYEQNHEENRFKELKNDLDDLRSRRSDDFDGMDANEIANSQGAEIAMLQEIELLEQNIKTGNTRLNRILAGSNTNEGDQRSIRVTPSDAEDISPDLTFNDTDTGLNSMLLKTTSKDGKTVYIYSIAGTADGADVAADAKAPIGLSSQYAQSLDNARLIRDFAESQGAEFVVTGHSLGGGQAASIGLQLNAKAATYNAAGTNFLSNGLTLNNGKSHIDSYTNVFDPLNLVQDIVYPFIGTVGRRDREFIPSWKGLYNGHSIKILLRSMQTMHGKKETRTTSTKMKKYIILLLLMLSSMTCIFANRETLVKKHNLNGYDYRLFQQTPAWNLAKAVEDEDLKKIESILQLKKVPVDYQESRFKLSLLMMAVKTRKYESTKKLLESGANPNLQSNKLTRYKTAMFYAASVEDAKYLKLLLKHGGNPNTVINNGKNTPLMEACSHSTYDSLGHIKALVEAGADVNYKTPHGHTPLSMALVMEQMDVILYLLNKSVDYRVVIYTVKGKKFYIENKLRFRLFPLSSEQYKKKMKVVEFLKQKGIDYRATPIPENMVEKAKRMYPNSWQEYLKKY